MDASIRRLALRAAAKAAMSVTSVTFLGCGGAVETSQGTHNDALAQHDAATADVGSSDGAGALLCHAAPEGKNETVSESTFQCCVETISGLFGDASFAAELPATDRDDPGVLACCDAVIRRVDQDTPDAFPGDYETATAKEVVLPPCCKALDTPTGRACTPWGPPVPPEMDFFAAEAA